MNEKEKRLKNVENIATTRGDYVIMKWRRQGKRKYPLF